MPTTNPAPTPAALVPVTLLTGFLGSGKTTLVNRLLTEAHGRRLAVLVNEFGELGIDGALVQKSSGPVVELANGCVCCATQGDLFAALDQLLATRDNLDGILVETSGLANPGPVIDHLERYQTVQPVRFDSVVTVIDADNFDRNLDNAEVAFEQITYGDLLLVNKADLVDAHTLGLIRQGLRKLNTTAPVLDCVQAAVPVDVVLGAMRVAGGGHDHEGHGHGHGHGHDDHGHHDHHDHSDHHDHAAGHGHEGFDSVVLRTPSPLHLDRFTAWIDALPASAFRLKGFARFVGEDETLVVHVVGRRRAMEPAAPGSVAPTVLVVIGRDLDPAALQASFAACASDEAGQGEVPPERPLALDVPTQRPVALDVRDLQVRIRTDAGTATPVRGVTLEVRQGECVAVVGESGSGKSVSFLSVLGLLPWLADCDVEGLRQLGETDLGKLDAGTLRQLLGSRIAMVFQDPLSALNPVFRVGDQVAGVIRTHEPDVSAQQAWTRAVQALEQVRIPNAAARARDYPHQFSGGMRQRVLIAMAIACRPQVLVADEPTTALDVTVQAEVLALLDQLRRDLGMAMVLITHDLGVVASYADRVAVMYAGRVVEQAPAAQLFAAPAHPYTRALLASVPRLGERGQALAAIPGEPPNVRQLPQGCAFRPRCQRSRGREACVQQDPPLAPVPGRTAQQAACHYSTEVEPLPIPVARAAAQALPGVQQDVVLRIDHLGKTFDLPGKRVLHALRDVSLELRRGETLGIVGESGSGKSTLARCVLHVHEPSSGSVQVEGQRIDGKDKASMRHLRSRVQMVFQDARAALNPRMTIGASVAEPLVVSGRWGDGGEARVAALLQRVGLSADHARRFPHELSGGQQQRVGIARALVGGPAIVVLDEPIASLDVSIRAQIINLLRELQAQDGLSYLFIAHDISVVHHFCDRVAVMYLGRIVEVGDADGVCMAPLHPYTQLLVQSVPEPDPVLARSRPAAPPATGERPDPANPPSGCVFSTRCPRAVAIAASGFEPTVGLGSRTVPVRCASEQPPLASCGGRTVACHFAESRAGAAVPFNP